MFSVGYRRHEDGGAIRKGATSGVGGGGEPAGGGAGVRSCSQNGKQDAGVFGATWISAAEAGDATEAGLVAGRDRRDLEDDKQRPKKQRHTAKRIFERLRAEHVYTGGYTIVKDYVRSSKIDGQENLVGYETS